MDTHNNQDSNKNNHLDTQNDQEQRTVAADIRQPQQTQHLQKIVTRSVSDSTELINVSQPFAGAILQW